MSEFSTDDVNRWLDLALTHNCSIEKAIHYDNFFSEDPQKYSRAVRFMLMVLREKLKYEFKIQGY